MDSRTASSISTSLKCTNDNGALAHDLPPGAACVRGGTACGRGIRGAVRAGSISPETGDPRRTQSSEHRRNSTGGSMKRTRQPRDPAYRSCWRAQSRAGRRRRDARAEAGSGGPAYTTRPPCGSAVGAEVDHVVRAPDHVEIVLDHDHARARIEQRVEAVAAGSSTSAGCRPVVGSSKHVERARLRLAPSACARRRRCSLAARERRERLAEREIAEPDARERREPLRDAAVARRRARAPRRP